MTPAPTVVACLITRDEELALPDCLASLQGHVDAVVVHDTGSTDRTVQLARAAGCAVVRGTWQHDFAQARDVALREARRLGAGEWVLSIDADERLVGDPRTAAAAAPVGSQALSLALRSTTPSGTHTHRAARLFRLRGSRWLGRVHEQVADLSGQLLPAPPVAAGVCLLEHTGYRTVEAERAKGERNAELAAAELAALRPTDPRATRLRLDLARSLLAAGRTADALEAFLLVRDASDPGTAAWAAATDFACRVLLAAGEHELARATAEELRRAGGPGDYCDWLAAQALAQLGRPDQALALLEPLTELVDPEGRHHDPGALLETRALTAALCGRLDQAVDDLVRAMADHGRVTGRGALAAELWQRAGRPADALWAELSRRAATAQVQALLAAERAS